MGNLHFSSVKASRAHPCLVLQIHYRSGRRRTVALVVMEFIGIIFKPRYFNSFIVG